MKEIKLNFPVNDFDRPDQLNAIMSYIVNRACGFNRSNFDCILIEKNCDSVKSFMLYRAAAIIAMVKSIPIYMNKNFAYPKWLQEKNDNLHKVSSFKLNRIKKKEKPLIFSTACYGEENQPNEIRIFDGITEDKLSEIAEELYNYIPSEENE